MISPDPRFQKKNEDAEPGSPDLVKSLASSPRGAPATRPEGVGRRGRGTRADLPGEPRPPRPKPPRAHRGDRVTRRDVPPPSFEGGGTTDLSAGPAEIKRAEPITKTSSRSDGRAPGNAGSAICVQRLDDSLNSAIHTTYRSLLRSSSMHEPRGPPLEVVSLFFRSRNSTQRTNGKGKK